MSRLFKKSKKSLVILLTIAFVMSIAAVPAFASTSYSSLSSPTVPDAAGQQLGTVAIEIDPIVDSNHRAFVEVEDGWDINAVTVTRVVYNDNTVTDATYADFPHINIDGEEVRIGSEDWWDNGDINPDPDVSVEIDDDSFVLDFINVGDLDEIEVWLQFTSVDVDDTGNIYANFTGLMGQLTDGDALIGRGRGGELDVVVRDATSFVTEGEVEIRVTEDLEATWQSGDALKFELPRYFVWKHDGAGNPVDGDGDPIELTADDRVFGNADLTEFDFTTGRGGRDLLITPSDDFVETTERSSFDFTAVVEVDDDERASKGDIVANLAGAYDTNPDEIIVGVFGDFDITITPDDIETVYAGKTEQDIADITIEEDVGRTMIPNRILTLTLPDWAVWVEDSIDDFSDDHRGLEIDFRDLRRDGRQARFDISGEFEDRGDPATLELEDFEIALSTAAEGDVVVEVGGTAGVFGDVTVAEAVPAVEMELEDVPFVESGRSGQQMATVYITETAAGNFSDGGTDNAYVTLMMGRYIEWDSGYTVEVVGDGDIDLGPTTRRTVDGYTNRALDIRVDAESDVASTIKVTGYATVHRGAPIGANNVTLTGSSVHDGSSVVAVEDDEDVTLGDRFAPMPPAASGVIAYVDEEPVLDVTEVVMWIGLTTYTVNGEAKEMDVAPFIENDRTFVPVSFIAAEFGLEADWGPVEGLTEWVTFECEDMDILVEIEIGSPYITVTEEGVSRTVTSDVAAQIVGDRTYLPLRAVGEIFGATFDWGPKETLTEWVSFTMMN